MTEGQVLRGSAPGGGRCKESRLSSLKFTALDAWLDPGTPEFRITVVRRS